MSKTKIIHLESLGLIKLSPGADAKKLLQGQLTCNVEKVSTTHTTLGAQCNPQGRIISFFRLLMIEDDYYLLLPKQMLPVALSALKKYAPFYKVGLQEIKTELSVYGLIGDLSMALQTSGITAIRLPETTPRYVLIMHSSVLNQLSDLPELAPETTWKYLEITAGIPSIYPDTCEKFLPHELDLHLLSAISFDKGCYTGQEIIARMQYRGKLKNHLYRGIFTLETAPHYGSSLADDGIIVDYAQIDYNNYLILFISPESKIGKLNGKEITRVHGAT